jgi:16S rRNA (adenine1518-N6/adenine1519-N6)-dimethyltransferase
MERVLDVPPGAFHPVPKVESAVVRMTPFARLPHPARDEDVLRKIVAAAFSQRRKTLRNALRELLDAGELEQLGIEPGVRGETLGVPEFVRIANYLATRGR